MASPLRWFRKHSFFFIVVFGVVLMGIFGLGSVITGLNPGDMARQATAENKVLAKWSGGELKEKEVQFLRQKHFASQRLMQEVYKYAMEQNGGNAFRVGVEPIRSIVRQGENPTPQQMDEEVMFRYLMAKRAEDEGYIVDENMVLDFLGQFSGDVGVTKNILKDLNRRANPSMPLTPVIRHLQQELLWLQMESMANGGMAFSNESREGIAAINPTEAVELFARTNRTIECKVVPLSVDEYVSKITDEPSESELRELYEKGKFDYPIYNFSEPGFKQLRRANIQYFFAKLDTFVENEMAKLTDEQVQEEYNKLVEAEDNLVMQVVPEQKDAADSDTTDPDATDAADTPVVPEEGSGTTAPAPAADSVKPTIELESPATETVPAETVPAETVPTETEGSGSAGEGGYVSLRPQQEVPEQTPAESVPAPGAGTTETVVPTEQAPGSDPATIEEVVGSDTTQEVVPTETAPGESTETPVVQTETPADADGSEKKMEPSDPVIDDNPKVKREPKALKDVADDIKRRMVTADARAARDAALDSAEKEISKFQMLRDRFKFGYDGNQEDKEEPAVPNFLEIADKYGVQFAETGLVDETQIGDEQIGQVIVFDIANRRAVQIADQLFQAYENVSVFQPLSAEDFRDNAKYLYWFAEKVDQKVPTFDEARESVVKYWKRNQAIESALSEAESIAEKANSQKKLLSDLYPDEAVDTGGFSWFSKFGRFAYGTPVGVTAAGEDFMKSAFELGEREVGVAMNETRDTVYAVQNVSTVTKSTNQIASDYLKQHFFQTRQVPQEVISAKQEYRRKMAREWNQEFRKEMDIQVVGQ